MLKYSNNQTKVDWLVWILENHKYVMENFDEVRNNFWMSPHKSINCEPSALDR